MTGSLQWFEAKKYIYYSQRSHSIFYKCVGNCVWSSGHKHAIKICTGVEVAQKKKPSIELREEACEDVIKGFTAKVLKLGSEEWGGKNSLQENSEKVPKHNGFSLMWGIFSLTLSHQLSNSPKMF